MSDSLFVCSIFDQACSESSRILHGWNWYSSKSGAFCNPSKRAASDNQVILNRMDQSVFSARGRGRGRLENYFRGGTHGFRENGGGIRHNQNPPTHLPPLPAINQDWLPQNLHWRIKVCLTIFSFHIEKCGQQ